MPSDENETVNEEDYATLIFEKISLIATFFCMGSHKYITGPTLLHLSIRVEENVLTVPYIFIARSAGYIGGSILGNIVYQRILYSNRKILLIFFVSLLLTATTLFISLSRRLLTLLIWFFASGVTMAGMDTGVNALCLHSRINPQGPFFWSLYVFHGLGALSCALVVRSYTEQNYIMSANQPDDKKSNETRAPNYPFQKTTSVPFSYAFFSCLTFIITILWLCNYFLSASRTPERTPPTEEIGFKMRRFVIANASILSFLSGCVDSGYAQVLPLYGILSLGMNQVRSIEVLILFLGCYTLGRLVATFLSFKIRSDNFLFVGNLLIFIGSLIPFSNPMKDEINFWLFNAILGLGAGPLFHSLYRSLCHKIYITHQHISQLYIMNSVSEMIIPLVLSTTLSKHPVYLRPFILTVSIIHFVLLLLQCCLILNVRELSSAPDPELLTTTHVTENPEDTEVVVESQEDAQEPTQDVEETLMDSMEKLKLRVIQSNIQVVRTLQSIQFSGAQSSPGEVAVPPDILKRNSSKE